MSLLKKLIYAYMFILAIPIIGFALYFFNDYKKNINEKLLQQAYQDVDNIKNDIEHNIETFNRIYKTIISNRELMNFIDTKEEVTTKELLEFTRTHVKEIERIQFSNPDLYRIRIFIENEKILERWPIIYHVSRIEKESWYTKLKESNAKQYWIFNHQDVLTHLEESQPIFITSLYTKITEYGKDGLGFIEISMPTQTFFYYLYNQNDSDEKNSFMCFIDSNDKIYFDFENDFLKNNNLNIQNIKNKLIESKKGQKGFLELDNQKVIAVYQYIDVLDTYIYKIIYVKDLLSNSKDMLNIVLITSFILIFVLSIFTYFITSIILKKLKLIIQSMREVQKGNLNIEIPVVGNDEIGELAYNLRLMLKKINDLIKVVLKKHKLTKDAQISALQSQINAHFIYNVLEAIKMMAEIQEAYEISDVVTSLGKLMRYSMRWKIQVVKLQEEIEYIKNYIKLINIRYDYQVYLNIDIESDLMQYEILKMSLQPAVENAIKHGINPLEEDAVIRIKSYREDEKVIIEISDTGIGMSLEKLHEVRENIYSKENKEFVKKGNGIGLKNIHERIQVFYGEEYGLEIMSKENCYTKVRLILPYYHDLRRRLEDEEYFNSR
ncbi:cache domain-containing sensor histidine kinase [Defluviitalea phaphyphila]|uniref:cache domain-containing sensor histidine kinase n=1 Tax=Defluviitalea phaphyphila TaxID=1473580 RepID=UPI0013663927|nr:sensor histidine kinase [Defluviitalea phaphyphila]